MSIIDALLQPRILVLGDLILDRYTWGNAERVSPEAPVLVLRVDSREVRLGGAASVAMLLRGLEAEVALAGVVGDDPEGRTLCSMLNDDRIESDLVVVDSDRPTTTKERFVGRAASRHPHQILRVDQETQDPISLAIEERLSATILGRLDEYRAILISDYAKGVCTPRLLQTVIISANKRGIPVIVDPARIKDYERYRCCTLLKPNRVEAELATGSTIRTPADALAAGENLRQQLEAASVLVTLDQEGMALVDAGSCRHFSTNPRTVYDITGAGDMVMAALGLSLASDVPLSESVQIANAAAGLEVTKFGVAPITRLELRRALAPPDATGGTGESGESCSYPKSQIDKPTSTHKLITLAEAVSLAANYRSQGKSIVFTNGCFDLLHVGHLTCLQEAAALGDVLFVGVNGDESVRAVKGPDRPIINERDRAAMLAAIDCVDHVLFFDDLTPHMLLETIRPDILAKGGSTTEIVGHEVVEAYGGRVLRLSESGGVSTTQIVSRIQTQRALRSEVRAGVPASAGVLNIIPHSEFKTPHFS